MGIRLIDLPKEEWKKLFGEMTKEEFVETFEIARRCIKSGDFTEYWNHPIVQRSTTKRYAIRKLADVPELE